MKIPTYAVIVGVSQYQSELFEPLPAAHADALHFARALVNWGIPESHIILMCGSLAKKEALEGHLKELSALKDPFQLVFYFAGHGYRTSGPDPQSYLIFSDTQVEANTCENGIQLEALLHALGLFRTTNTYLFIDACGLRLNAVINPKLKEEIEGVKDSKRNLFCVLSSGVFPSFESIDHQYGYFTEALVKALCNIRKTDRSPTALFESISKELEVQGLPQPEMYNIGTQVIDFLPALCSYVQDGVLIRQAVIADLQDLLVKNRNKVVGITGPSGSGKTILAQQLSSPLLKQYFIEDPQSLKDIEPHSVLILDSIDQKDMPEMFDRSLTLLLLMEDSSAVASWIEFSMPPLTYQETELLVQASHPTDLELPAEFYYLISKGNPQKVQQALHNFDDIQPNASQIENVKKAVAAIYSCGLFINEELFRKIFGIEISTLHFLEKIGFIFPKEGCWYPHDFLIEMAESERLELDREATLSYWLFQFDELPHHFEAALNVVLAIQCFDYEPKFDPVLKRAFQVLYKQGSRGVSGLREGVSIFSKITPSSLFLAEILLEWGELNMVNKLLSLPASSAVLSTQAGVIQSHLFWRMGLFSKCIQKAHRLIETLSASAEKDWCYLNRGASHFILGNWEEAKFDFSHIEKNAKDMKHIGWARCVLGTINGIRGIDVTASRDLIESGVRILIMHGDLLGAWIGWNNLGEIMWKAGEWRTSAYYLQKALEISKETTNNGALLETQRNLLQLELRTPHPNKSKIQNLLEFIEKGLDNMEILESMQVYNTLCTAYFYLKNNERAHDYLKKAILVTAPSKEYHIYTLANRSIFFKLCNMESKSATYLHQAKVLAKRGNNHFALKQIESDYVLLGL